MKTKHIACKTCSIDMSVNVKSKNTQECQKCKENKLTHACAVCNKPTTNKNTCSKSCGNVYRKQQIRKSVLAKHGVANVFELESVKASIVDSHKSRTGYDYPSQNPLSKNKAEISRKETCVERYGVDNVRKSTAVKAKINNTMVKHGHRIDWEMFSGMMHDPDMTLEELAHKTGYSQSRLTNKMTEMGLEWRRVRSTLENQLFEFVKQTTDLEVKQSDRKVIAPQELDIFVPDLNLAFEFNGIFWHSENARRVFGKSFDKNTQRNKTSRAAENGYRLIHVWEDHWKHKQHIVKSIIKLALGKPDRVLNARDCEVRNIQPSVSRAFNVDNHLYEHRGAQVHLGLFHSEELVAVMTFGQSKYNKNFGWELIRYAPVLNTSINGAAHRLWKRFVRDHKPHSVICYADASLFTGSLYEKLGFVNEGQTPANNWYVIDWVRRHRMGFTKKALRKKGMIIDEALTAHQNMLLHNNSLSIWDCGSYKLTWHAV